MNNITNYHNVTNIVLDWADPYDQLDGKLWIKSGIMVFQVCCLLIWTILGIGMVSYERFGEDPQKRGLGNQILTQHLKALLVQAWICLPAVAFRIVYRPLSGWINYVTVYLGFYTAFLLTFNIVEYYGLRYLAVVVLRRMPPILDDFFARFMLQVNLSLTALLTYVNMLTSESMMYSQRLAGLQPFFWIDSKIKISPMGWCMLLQTSIPIYCSLMIKREKAKLQNLDEAPNENRSTHNKEAITTTLGIVIVFVATAFLMADKEANLVEDYNDDVARLALYLASDLFYSFLLVAFACYFYVKSSELRSHLVDLVNL